ncbi:MAG: M23 family metallopeptidase [Frankia sp.]|nr:M23 family metallopeptidase [Frankia sp.]
MPAGKPVHMLRRAAAAVTSLVVAHCRRLAALLLVGAVLAGCGGEPTQPVASPAPAVSTASPSLGPLPPVHVVPSRSAGSGYGARPPASAVAHPPVAAPPPGRVSYRFPVAACATSYGHSHHDYPATDIFAARGCAYVAPVDGVVDEVSRVDRWRSTTNRGADRGGLSVSVVGDDGVRYYGSHLQAIASGVASGVRVAAGTPLGQVGNTGSARGGPTHLHFGISWPTRDGIWWVRRGMVYPWPYLDSWRAGGQGSPARAVRAARQRAGSDEPPCTADC